MRRSTWGLRSSRQWLPARARNVGTQPTFEGFWPLANVRTSAMLAVLAAAAVLAACGGDSGSTAGAGDTSSNSASSLTPDKRSASLDAIDAELASLPGIDAVADNQSLAQFISSQPEFAAAGTADGG